MPPFAARSRRALVGSAALAAFAPATEAKRKKKKRKKPQPPPPLAFAVGALVDVGVSGDGTRFDAVIELAFLHPASGLDGETSAFVSIDIPASDAELRAEIAAEVRQFVVTTLVINGQDVPPDRVAVAVM